MIRAAGAGGALAGPVVYAAVAADRGASLVGTLGGLGVVLIVVGAFTGFVELVPAGIAVVGTEYAIFFALGDDVVRLGVPLVAAALLVAAELGYSALEPPLVPASLGIRLRRALRSLVLVACGVAVSALVVFAAAADVGDSAGLRLVGLAAAVATVGLLAALARTSA